MTTPNKNNIEKVSELVKRFKLTRILDTNPQIKTITLLGNIDSENAILTLEKTHFSENQINEASQLLANYRDLTANDIYYWSLASLIETNEAGTPTSSVAGDTVKFNLVYPATELHIKKYAEQKVHMIKETPEMYKKYVVPYIEELKATGRLNWVYNILHNGYEAERTVYNKADEFVLIPDMKWSGHDMDSLYLCAIVYRRDIASIRDLNINHKEWLISLQDKIKKIVPETYPKIEDASQLRIFVHYQPSYYHFHIHVVNIKHPGLRDGITVGKAILLDDIIDNLDHLGEAGYMAKNITYALGENHALWDKMKHEL